MLNTRPSTANMVACLERRLWNVKRPPVPQQQAGAFKQRGGTDCVGNLTTPRGSKIPGTISRTFLPPFRNGRIYTAGGRAERPAYSRLSLAV